MPSGLGRLLISHCHWGGFPLIVTETKYSFKRLYPSPGLSRHSVMRQFPLSLSFPSGVPSDARRWPFSYTACVSQASGSSELIPCTRLQTREIVSRVRNPQRWARCFLSTFRWLRCHEKLAPEYPERYRRSLIIEANRLLFATKMTARGRILLGR